MKSKVLLLLLVAVAAGAGCAAKEERRASAGDKFQPAASHGPARGAAGPTAPPQQQAADDGHGHGQPGAVPAFETDLASLKSLKPTLSPALFYGKQKEGYEAAKAIPQTLAQLPCYCHCDKGFGHKSLHSCYVDNHASMCAVCVDEVLLAYNLQKQEKLTPEQIRERIITQYSSQGY